MSQVEVGPLAGLHLPSAEPALLVSPLTNGGATCANSRDSLGSRKWIFKSLSPPWARRSVAVTQRPAAHPRLLQRRHNSWLRLRERRSPDDAVLDGVPALKWNFGMTRTLRLFAVFGLFLAVSFAPRAAL